MFHPVIVCQSFWMGFLLLMLSFRPRVFLKLGVFMDQVVKRNVGLVNHRNDTHVAGDLPSIIVARRHYSVSVSVSAQHSRV